MLLYMIFCLRKIEFLEITFFGIKMGFWVIGFIFRGFYFF